MTFLILAVWIAISRADAHPALYHYLEINLHEPGTIRVFVTLHAPELSDDGCASRGGCVRRGLVGVEKR